MEEEKVEKCGMSYYVPSETVTFAELESAQKAAEVGRAVQDLTYQFERMISNILYSSEVNNKSAAIKRLTDEYTSRLDKVEDGEYMKMRMEESLDPPLSVSPNGDSETITDSLSVSPKDNLEKSPIKRENGLDFPARDYGFVPDPDRPATWKLRLTDTPGKISLAQLGRAAAALSAGGFRGQKAQIPASALSAVKRRIRAEYRKLGVTEDKIPASVKKAFTVWKSADGQWRWFAVYSNNFRDRDNPPEIISEKSHTTFVGLVEKEIVPKPELWHWHIPGSKWGTTELVGYDNGFAWAAGVVDPGHEKEAENLSLQDDIRMSHGMPSRLIKRQDSDNTVIDFHITTEISDLPGDAAANALTEFLVFEGVSKMTDAQKEYLTTAGLSEDEITALASGFASKEQAAVDAGVERKESDDKAKKPMSDAEDEEDEEEDKKEVPLTAQSIADAIGMTIKPILAELKSLRERVGSQEAQMKEVQVFANERKELTPSLSLQDLIGQSILGSPEAAVDGRTSLAKSKPKTKVAEVTPVGFLNRIIAED